MRLFAAYALAATFISALIAQQDRPVLPTGNGGTTTVSSLQLRFDAEHLRQTFFKKRVEMLELKELWQKQVDDKLAERQKELDALAEQTNKAVNAIHASCDAQKKTFDPDTLDCKDPAPAPPATPTAKR